MEINNLERRVGLNNEAKETMSGSRGVRDSSTNNNRDHYK